jgi:hypothetical protein
LKILYIFFEPRVIGRHGRTDIGGCWKGPKKLLQSNKDTQKDIMDAKNINVLLGEN